MRILISLLGLLSIVSGSLPAADNLAQSLWNELREKRLSLPSVHQEFDLSRTFHNSGASQSVRVRIVLDMTPRAWLEASLAGSGNTTRLFDGQHVFQWEDEGSEFTRNRKPNPQERWPAAYAALEQADSSRVVERERRPCGNSPEHGKCVLFEAPLNSAISFAGQGRVSHSSGSLTAFIDLQTGLLIALRKIELVENDGRKRQIESAFTIRRFSVGGAPNDARFVPPAPPAREVKELSRWDAAKIRRVLVGKPAPELTVRDIDGQTIRLSALQGKTVLLDFWTTWCPPCRKDAPALDSLHKKFAGRDLIILGISVNEDRELVTRFLREHPKPYAVALTTENDMPRPYQISLFPTYLVIAPDGTVSAVSEGGQGFADLRGMLKKSGFDVK